MKIEVDVVDGGFDPWPLILVCRHRSLQRRDVVFTLVVDLGQPNQLEVIRSLLHLGDA